MSHENRLNMVSPSTIQKIYQCLLQAVGEDYQEAERRLDLKTHISKPFLIWDFINRNLINTFPQEDILYAVQKRGMWEVLVLFDKESKLILSFMKDTRFKEVRKARQNRIPKYIKALLLLNNKLKASAKQQRLFPIEMESTVLSEQLKDVLDKLCSQFTEPIEGAVEHHALIVFSTSFGALTSLNAYVLDKDLDVVDEQDWLYQSHPVMTNAVEIVDKESAKIQQPKLTAKAKQRRQQKELVVLKHLKGKESELD